MLRKTFAEINLDHLQFNIRLSQQHLSPGTFFCPMVKANAYGHGDVVIARALEKMGIKTLGVCLVEEGILLRQFGIQAQILVFRGFDLEGAQEIKNHKLTPVVSDWSHLEVLDKVLQEPYPIHLKFNTGMNRLGFELQEATKVYEFVQKRKKFIVEGVLTHLFQGEDGVDSAGQTFEQLKKFAPLCEIFKEYKPHFHILNSGGLLSQIFQKAQKQDNILTQTSWGVRPGLMIYGYNPLLGGEGLSLKPVMNLKSQVSVFRSVARGQGVSYNHTWKAEKDALIAVVPVGYADGIHRVLSNKTTVLFQGHRVPVVGQICMDFVLLDVTSLQAQGLSLKETTEVIFFGTDAQGIVLSAHEQATAASTITWEILTSVSERVPRVYRSQQQQYQEIL